MSIKRGDRFILNASFSGCASGYVPVGTVVEANRLCGIDCWDIKAVYGVNAGIHNEYLRSYYINQETVDLGFITKVPDDLSISVGDQFILTEMHPAVSEGVVPNGTIVIITDVRKGSRHPFGDVGDISLHDSSDNAQNNYLKKYYHIDTACIESMYVVRHVNDDTLVNKPKANPRKHAELIKQWADDHNCIVEASQDGGITWYEDPYPTWDIQRDYRIKSSKTIEKEQLLKEIRVLETRMSELNEKLINL